MIHLPFAKCHMDTLAVVGPGTDFRRFQRCRSHYAVTGFVRSFSPPSLGEGRSPHTYADVAVPADPLPADVAVHVA